MEKCFYCEAEKKESQGYKAKDRNINRSILKFDFISVGKKKHNFISKAGYKTIVFEE
jgi:hypothetical protein